jgi:DNA-binding HxlR family transcriptional regulator
MECPIARSLEEVGEWWSILILRDAFHGLRRFEEFQSSLGVATNTLTKRLADLVAHGLLERRRYCEHPPRDEYVLTDKGRDFHPVLLALLAWGNRHLADEMGPAVLPVDAVTGDAVEPVMVDGRTGKMLRPRDIRLVEGPTAGPEIRARLARAAIARATRAAQRDAVGGKP